jgi:putative DNA methylase
VEPVIEGESYRFKVEVGKKPDIKIKKGTKLSRANFTCLMSGMPISGDYIKNEGKSGRLSKKLMAIIVKENGDKLFLSPTKSIETLADKREPDWKPEVKFFQKALGFRIGNYGMSKWSDLFTTRQLVALSTFSDLIQECSIQVKQDTASILFPEDEKKLNESGIGANAYADAISTYLAIAVSRATDYWGTGAIWEPRGGFIAHVFTRNALPMSWDFPEANPFSGGSGSWDQTCLKWIERYLNTVKSQLEGRAYQIDAQKQRISIDRIVSTDPPYFDNIGYADLSDYFYVWMRRSMKIVFPDLFATLAVPKDEELVATPYRHGSKEEAEIFFLEGMTQAMKRIASQTHSNFPVSIYYAFKQSESDGADGTTNTGWDTFLAAVIAAGFIITGTWPIRTERPGRIRDTGSNALASSIVLICRKCSENSISSTRREFVTNLKSELPQALTHLQKGNIAPVDLAQAAIGPGMAVFTRYEKVLDAQGNALTVREALALINQILDETLAEQEGDFDADSRWALTWFDQMGFDEGEYGIAEQLSKSKNTSVSGLVDAGILLSKGGKVRLLTPDELDPDWNPLLDKRLTVWEMVHHLIRALHQGEPAAADLVAKLGTQAEVARELCYRLYTLCERKKRASQAIAYNSLVQSWPEITRLAGEVKSKTSRQEEPELF